MKFTQRSAFMQERKQWEQEKLRKLGIVIGIAILLIGGYFGYNYWKNSTAKPAGQGSSAVVADVMTVEKKPMQRRIVLSGQTVPKSQVDIAAKYQGRISEVRVELGDKVSAGQVLVVQDTTEAAMTVGQNAATYRQASADAQVTGITYDANFQKAKLAYENAQATYNRYQQLYSMGAISKQDLEIKALELASAKSTYDILMNQNNGATPASVESARAQAEKASYSMQYSQAQLDNLLLRTPRSGEIGFKQAEIGNIAQAGQKLLSVIDMSEVYVDYTISERDLAAFMVGQMIEVNVDSLGKAYTGKVTYISPASDINQQFTIRIQLNSPDDKLKAGMFVRSVVEAEVKADVIAVPKEAIMNRNGKTYLFVVNEKQEVKEQEVVLGATGDTVVEILKGIEVGNKIAITNISRLRDGIKLAPKSGGNLNESGTAPAKN